MDFCIRDSFVHSLVKDNTKVVIQLLVSMLTDLADLISHMF